MFGLGSGLCAGHSNTSTLTFSKPCLRGLHFVYSVMLDRFKPHIQLSASNFVFDHILYHHASLYMDL